ncbi:MAG: hypothetical protein BHW38_04225 [Firmicutes bacterium CAG:321_26_22]|nr:MAG: hypothetical protein BHW38_04225 [Firmicutes bacterium CAG:321_26_22]
MKKITKISKIFLVLTMIFSQLSSVVTVLADEITSKPLDASLAAVTDEELGYVEKYTLTYKSEKQDYDEEKEYTIELESSFEYLNGTIENGTDVVVTKTGSELNNEVNSSDLDPISTYYNGVYNLKITVKDNAAVIYEESIPYVVNTVKSGLVGTLNNGEVEPTNETLGIVSTGEYTVNEEKEYTQNLMIVPGNLSPDSNYKVTIGENEMLMTGEDIAQSTFDGSKINTTSSLGGLYNTNDIITIEELDNNDVVINTIDYTYDASINYDKNNDEALSELTGLSLNNGYLYEEAIGYNNSDSVTSIKEIVDSLVNTDIELSIYDENNTLLDLTNEEVLNSQLKNNYRVVFTRGTEVTYTVVVTGDNTSDNNFDSDDMKVTMNDYLEGNKVLSMDVVKGEDDEEGLLTFDDIMKLNTELNPATSGDVNINLGLVYGGLPKEIYVGDTFKLNVLVKSENASDYINGINALVTTGNNLKLTNVTYNSNLIGTFKDNNLVAAGTDLKNEEVLLTLEFTAIKEGKDSITLSGSIAKNENIEEFENLTTEVNVIRKISSNNNLSSLKASVGTFDIAFDKDVTVYTLTVPYDTESVILSGSLEDITSTVDGLIEYKLTDDKTTANITVVAEDGTIKVYTVYIIKEAKPENVATPVTYYYSSNNYLKSLEIDGYEITFNKETNEYKITVKSDVTSLDIKAIPEDSRARVEITGNEKFKKGNNTVTITVTAEDGSTREYKITANKESEKKEALTEIEGNSNTAEKVVIIILIILVVLGLLYLIFKKDEQEVATVEIKKEQKIDNKKTNKKN